MRYLQVEILNSISVSKPVFLLTIIYFEWRVYHTKEMRATGGLDLCKHHDNRFIYGRAVLSYDKECQHEWRNWESPSYYQAFKWRREDKNYFKSKMNYSNFQRFSIPFVVNISNSDHNRIQLNFDRLFLFLCNKILNQMMVFKTLQTFDILRLKYSCDVLQINEIENLP